MPFLVKSVDLTYAYSQTDIVGCYATGLNNKYNGANFQVTYDATNVMLRTDVTYDKGFAIDSLWGQVMGADKTFTSSSIFPYNL